MIKMLSMTLLLRGFFYNGASYGVSCGEFFSTRNWRKADLCIQFLYDYQVSLRTRYNRDNIFGSMFV